MITLEATIAKIGPIDEEAAAFAAKRQDTLTKPRGSLGVLEELSVRIAGMTGSPRPRLGRQAVFVMAADHGVCEEGVSAFPSEVTAQMALNFARGGAGINVLAKKAGATIVVTDVGIASDLPGHPAIRSRKVGRGTSNMAKGPAMSRDDAVKAIVVGIEAFEEENAASRLSIAATGDMGIGNTTSATAIACALLGLSPREVAGRGTGIDDAAFARKVAVIERALGVNKPDPGDAVDVLAKVGGFEIGALSGVILAAAARRVPVVIDGFISGAAALLARALCPASADYMIAAHVSADSGHARMLASLELEPLLDMGLRLGEGTGAALALPICDAACRILDEMATFGEAGVSDKG
jgi:nicotinate-nucleotide--dimethylbenzimidazole phosphoribosyltransferase